MVPDVRIRTKLQGVVALLVVSLAIVGALSVVQGRSTEQAMVRMIESDLELLVDLQTLYGNGLQSGQATRNVMLNPGDQAGKSNYRDADRAFTQALAHARSIAPTAMRDRLDQVEQAWIEDDALKRQVQAIAANGKLTEAVELLVKKETPRWREVRSTLLGLVKEQKEGFGAGYAATLADVHRNRWLVEVIAAATFLVAVLLTALVGRSITREVTLAVDSSRSLAAAVDRGELAARGDPSRLSEEFRPIVQAMNATMEAFVRPVRVSSQYLAALSRGDLPPRMEGASRGEFAEMQQNWNQLIEVATRRARDVEALLAAAREGRLAARVDVSAYQGGDARLLAGVNGLLEAVQAPVDEAVRVLERLAGRDLRARCEGEYRGEFGRMRAAVDATASALHEAILQVADSTGQVSQAAGQIAASSQDVARRASEQAASIQQATSSLETISGRTRRSADRAAQANALTARTRAAAGEGATAMEQMKSAMGKIRLSAQGTSQIIKDINEIAFQTNLLALNAAVEAARAGEAGRGFAVVAEEVRSLALRSKEAASKTEALIRESVNQAGEGEATSRLVAAKLGEIVTAVGEVAEIVGEISSDAKEQAEGIEGISSAIARMDASTQHDAASSEESSSAAQELSAESEELAAMVASFQLDHGQGAAPPASASKVAPTAVGLPAAWVAPGEAPRASAPA